MVFAFDDTVKTVARLKVVGVGGAGGNAINRMVTSGLQGVEFIAVNTDAMALEHNRADVKIAIGQKLTGGLGAGANPQVGMMSMQEDRERVRAQLDGADMVFIAAGMGGGTGTGAAPVVAEIAREMGVLTVAVVTRPFLWEGPVREKNANTGLDALRKSVDTVIVVPNQKLLSVVNKSTPLREAFKMADDILSSATRGISEIILKHGDIQVDFADVRSIMSQGGDALMGTGCAGGENRATIAADRAIHSPLLDNVSIAGATGVLVNITGGEDLGIMEVSEAMNYIYEAVGTETHANIIFGTVINPEYKDEVAITVIATGFGQKQTPPAQGRPGSALEPRKTSTSYQPGLFHPDPVRTVAPRGMEAPAAEPPKEVYPRAHEESGIIPGSSARVPFGKPLPAKPGLTGSAGPGAPGIPGPVPREEENRMYFNDSPAPRAQESSAAPAQDVRKGAYPGLGQAQKGRYKDMDADVDYETPAFLRNQAD